MKLFEKQAILYKGNDKAIYLAYRDLCEKNNIDYKVYDTGKAKVKCFGSPSGYGTSEPEHGFTIFVPHKDLEKVKALARGVIRDEA